MAAKKWNQDEFLLSLSSRLKEVSRKPNIKKYTPHEKQHLFHSSERKKKLYIGGNRSGKTTGGVTEAIWRASCTHPYRPELNAIGPNHGRVVAVDFTQGVDKIIIPQYQQWTYPSILRGGSWETAYDRGSRTLNFSNGSTIEFMSYDQDLDKFAGTSRHWTHFDEEPPRSIWQECTARLIDTNGDYWMTMTPVEGMTWIYDDLYEENVDNPNGDVLVIEINMLENPFLNEEAIQSFIKGLDDDDVQTRVGGAFVQQGGKIYKNFDPTPGALQVLPTTIDCSDPRRLFPAPEWMWIISLDHGLNNPTAVYWTAVNSDGFAVIFAEHYRAEWTIDQHAKFINDRNREFGRLPDVWVADPSIINRNAITNTSVLTEYQKYGIGWMSGNNDVKSGIVRVKRYFNPTPLVRSGYDHALFTRELSVNRGINPKTSEELQRLEFARLRISTECPHLIKELKKYRWKTYSNKKLQYENNAFDEPHKKDDHGCDSIRYMIMTQPDLVSEGAQSPGEKVREINEALGNLSFGNGPHPDFDDPYGLTAEGSTWQPGNSMPHESSGWSFDEHLGGIY